MPDTNVPTPWPGSKPSAPDRGDPRAATDKSTAAEESAANKPAEPTPAQRASQIKEHATALEQVFGKAQAPGGTPPGETKPATVNEAVDKAVAGVKANPDPEYN
jgi:hypothetical protein